MLGVDPCHDGAGPRAAASLTDPLVVLGPNRLSDNSRDLDAGPSQLGGPARIIPIEADVQKLHTPSVKTGRLYVNQTSSITSVAPRQTPQAGIHALCRPSPPATTSQKSSGVATIGTRVSGSDSSIQSGQARVP